ncbi:hypothetical protein ACG04Q_04000 [Roseateles sp. DXS20W]|uniref:Uncharacterized protein n=1 Tax=Pelomonas lactea TaxID=3299030 RepID=A0ABW7GFJ0_9BURK
MAAVLFAANAAAQVAPRDVQKRVEDCAESGFSWLACAQGIERQALPSPGIARSRHVLSIQTPGRTLRLVDEIDSTGYQTVAYSYLGRVGPAQHHVVLRMQHESSEHLLIDSRSGRMARMPAYPVVSPDGRHFVAASADLTAGFQPNVIEVWSALSTGFRREAVFKPVWGPDSASWTAAERVDVAKICLLPTDAEPKPCGHAQLVREGGRWRLVD